MLQYLVFFFALCFALPLAHAQETGKKKPKVPEKIVIKRQDPNLGAGRIHDSLLREQAKLTHIDGHYIPLDLYDCFRALDTLMEQGVRERFMAIPDAEVDARTHASLGLWLNNRWKISEGSRLSLYFNKMKIPHPQYMVGLVITTYHRHLHKRDLGIRELVQQYQTHWQEKQRKKDEALYLRAVEEGEDIGVKQ